MNTPELTLTDPKAAPKPAWFLDHLFLKLIQDPRDLPFARVQLMNFVVLTGLATWLFIDFQWYNALIMFAWYFWQLGPYTLMLHNVSHRKYFKKQHQWLYWPFISFLGMYFGHTPEAYFAHHVAMHHPENNLEDDLSSTMHLQRDSFSDFFIHYLMDFYIFGERDLLRYLKDHNRNKVRRRLMIGTLTWVAIVVGMCFISWQASLFIWVLPVIVTRFMMMAGNWAQHSFVDEAEPENCYKNSITCINATYNRTCFNDGYHISHHWKATRHWTEHPDELLENLEEYAKNDAIIFQKLDFFIVWLFLMLKRYDWLAKNYVEIDGKGRSQEEIIALLKERTQRIPHTAPGLAG